tara:strand:+ start:1372 stop:2904 length:1533 start_codon:yes stop_codon:yes gene_type:complete
MSADTYEVNTSESEEIPLVDDATITEEEHHAIMELLCNESRDDFAAFLHTMYPQTDNQKYILSDFHLHLAEIVQGVVDGTKSPNQSVSVPPQHGKSRLLSVRAVAWIAGRTPDLKIVLTGFSSGLLSGFLREIKDIMALPLYQDIFPDVEPVRGNNTKGGVLLTNGTTIMIFSAGTKLTGTGVDWLIVDDPHAGRFEAESPHQRKKVEQWFFADCVSRLSPSAKVFLISTRWHPEDLHGVVTDTNKEQDLIEAGFEDQLFQVTNLPAMSDGKDKDPLGREEGAALFPEQRDHKFLELLKVKMPSHEWDSQYLGRPRASTGDVVDVKKLRMIDMEDVPRDIEWYRGWDLAITDKSTSDYTAGPMCALRKDPDTGEPMEFYIIDMVRAKEAWAKMRFTVIETSRNDLLRGVPCHRTGIEAVAGFIAVMADVKAELMGRMKVEQRNFRGGKLLRAQPWLNMVEAGRVYVVRGSWNKEFTLELERFPLGNHDDQVDGVSICWEGLNDNVQLLLA